MRNTRKRLMECLQVLRTQIQVDLLLTNMNRALCREVANDAICGA